MLLIGLMSVSAGRWSVISGNWALGAMQIVFASLFFGYLPIFILKEDRYRLASYVVEILLGFVVFVLLYLSTFSDIGSWSVINWMLLSMLDSVGVMTVGFCGAMIYVESTK